MIQKIPTGKRRRDKETLYSNRCWWWLVNLFIITVLALIVMSCSEESVHQGGSTDGLPAVIRLNAMPDAATQTQTRVMDEGAINDLHVLVYNSENNLIGKNYSTSSTITINTRSGSGYTLYAIANTGDENLFDGTVADTAMKLKAMKTAMLTQWDDLNTASQLLMTGSITDVTVGDGNTTPSKEILVSRTAAKVTLNIGVKSGSGITIDNYQVFSLPVQSYYVSDASSDGASEWIDGVEPVSVNADAVSKSFYMYENRRGINSAITDQANKGTVNALVDATYVVIKGKAFGYEATWRVYLGGNNTSDFNMNRNTSYTYKITLSRPGAGSVDTRVEVGETFIISDKGVSNSYMMEPGSGITIPVVRANESFLPIEGSTTQLELGTEWTASLVWETSPGLVRFATDKDAGTGYLGRFTVIAPDPSIEGNALVAIKNGSNQILWSWHIWITKYDGTSSFVNPSNKLEFMDRNLGATSATAGELATAGLLYQWGRKDPFPGIGQEGGGWKIATNNDPVQVYNDSGTRYTIDKKDAELPSATTDNLANATRNPDTYYFGGHSKNWFTPSASVGANDDLWAGSNNISLPAAAKSVFDPCPEGWRVPPFLEGVSPFSDMHDGWAHIGSSYSWEKINANFPLAGFRDAGSGNFSNVSTFGQNWIGTPRTLRAASFRLANTITVAANSDRSSGFSVRCCKENVLP